MKAKVNNPTYLVRKGEVEWLLHKMQIYQAIQLLHVIELKHFNKIVFFNNPNCWGKVDIVEWQDRCQGMAEMFS